MAISKKRLEELACQFLMMTEILSDENEQDIYENLSQLSDVTMEELEELNFPDHMYQRRKAKQKRSKAYEQR